MTLAIQQPEYEERLAGLTEQLIERGLTGAVLFDPYYVLYYAGFAFAPTERPIAFVLNAEGKGGMLVPRLEREHAQANASVDHVADYPEYPSETHPMESLRGLLGEMGVREPFGADQDGYPWVLGYRGPSLTELVGATPEKITGFVEDQLAVKSPAEIELIRESSKWGNLAHVLLQRYTRPGLTESEVSRRASTEASLAMLDAIGPIYRAQSFFFDGASAGYRGQIGRNAAIPHALANNIVFQEGDVLVTGATAPVWGYLSELERTMVIGEPSAEQRKLFDHMVALQDTAFEAIKPGATLFGRRPRRSQVLRRPPPLGLLEAPCRPRDRPSLSRRTVPRHRRRHGDQARDGVHRRARPLRRRPRWVSPLRHRRRHRRAGSSF